VATSKLAWDAPAPFDGQRSLAEALLVPTRIYVKSALGAIRDTGAVKALAHITGGGLTENLPRVLPDGLAAHIDLAAWTAQPVFGWLQRIGNIPSAELLRTFNCGIGMVAVTARKDMDRLATALRAAGESAFVLGEVEPGSGAKVSAKGKGSAAAVRYSGTLRLAE
jgi:phosphoribosylformylglycinamidine cyclo-ligase